MRLSTFCGLHRDTEQLGRHPLGSFIVGHTVLKTVAFMLGHYICKCTPGLKKRGPPETNVSIKKTFKGMKPLYATCINTYTSNGWSTLLTGWPQPASWA
jgi:hypothetical protein